MLHLNAKDIVSTLFWAFLIQNLNLFLNHSQHYIIQQNRAAECFVWIALVWCGVKGERCQSSLGHTNAIFKLNFQKKNGRERLVSDWKCEILTPFVIDHWVYPTMHHDWGPISRTLNLGRGHTNNDIQIIVAIPKVGTILFSTTPLDYWKNYNDIFGVTHAQYELQGYRLFCFSRADSIVNYNNIGL